MSFYGLSAEMETRFNKKKLGRAEWECGEYRAGAFAGEWKKAGRLPRWVFEVGFV